jgi:predicted patatin/cPLA2 family phospholipase
MSIPHVVPNRPANTVVPEVKTRKALIIEGGGTRGAFSVGVLYTLGIDERYRSLNHFGKIYAVSSAVWATTYYASGQYQEMYDFWRTRIPGCKFIDLRNIIPSLFDGRDVLKLDDLTRCLGEIKADDSIRTGPLHADASDVVPYDYNRLIKSGVEIVIISLNYMTGAPVYYRFNSTEHQDNPDPAAVWQCLLERMKAACAAPRLYNQVTQFDDAYLIDAGHSDSLPIKRAIVDGCDDITVILNQPQDARRPKPRRVFEYLYYPKSKIARQSYRLSADYYNRAVEFIKSMEMRLRSTSDSREASFAQAMADLLNQNPPFDKDVSADQISALLERRGPARRFKVVRPDRFIIRLPFNTSKKSIDRTIQHGIDCARREFDGLIRSNP